MPGPAADAPEKFTTAIQKQVPQVDSHEADTVALKDKLEGTRITRKGDHHSQFTPPSSKMVAVG